MRVGGGIPWIATVSGFVVFGAQATGWCDTADRSGSFDLSRPGAWFEHVGRRWFAFPAGRHWFFWDPWRLQQ
jgi:hypothetical protein